jgi:hypothetical protein
MRMFQKPILQQINRKSREIDKFLDKYDPQKFYQEEINNLNRSVTSNEIETVIKKKNTSQQRKAHIWMDSLLNSTRPLKKN